MSKTYFIIVDVGCIECGEQTEILGIYQSKSAAKKAFGRFAKERKIEKWEPRGGFLEVLGLYKKSKSTFIGGCGYFNGGQHALELHHFPAQALAESEQE